ncbi:MAG: hypothetical protein JJT78_18375 [Leptospira sp.]|nr:hypothetical protein [Leptospira sp.]
METTDEINLFYEDHGLEPFFVKNADSSPEKLADELLQDLDRFTDPDNIDPDDIAFVMLKRER